MAGNRSGWTEDRPMCEPFLWYRQEEDGPKISIPVLKTTLTRLLGRKYACAAEASVHYPGAFEFLIDFTDHETGAYTPEEMARVRSIEQLDDDESWTFRVLL